MSFKLFCFYCCLSTISVIDCDAERIVRVVLNKGIVPTEIDGYFCNDRDNALLDGIIAGNYRRNLMQPTNDTSINHQSKKWSVAVETNQSNIRDLQASYSARCLDYCRGYKTGTCRHTKCVGYRRRQQRHATRNRRTLQQEPLPLCSNTVARVTNEIDQLRINGMMSSSCQQVLQLPYSVDCFDEHLYTEITNFVLYEHVDNQIRTRNIANGETICSKGYETYNLEAISNNCDTGPVEIKLSSKINVKTTSNIYSIRGSASTENFSQRQWGRNSNVAPYTIFPSNAPQRLPFGTYEITTTLSYPSVKPTTTLQLTIQAC